MLHVQCEVYSISHIGLNAMNANNVREMQVLLAVCSCVVADSRGCKKYCADDVAERAGERSE